MGDQQLDEYATSETPRDPFVNPTLTIDEATRLYGLPQVIVRKAIERGELTVTLAANGQELLSRSAVLEWLKRRSAGWA